MNRKPEVVLETATRAQLLAEAQGAQPLEMCGALLGACDFGSWWRVVELLPLQNRSGNAEREYFISAEQVRAAERAAQSRGLEVIGFYHSHPASPAEPSRTDLERAWPGYLYIIAAAETGTVGCWTLERERTAFRPLSARP
jgi:proteasome lid subunit RPN8/RPN11